MKILTAIGIAVTSLMLFSCKTAKQAVSNNPVPSISPLDSLLQTTDLAGAHIGIAVYDPVAKTFLYQHQSDKYFIPASNTKIVSCYVAMKYLGDSLVGLRYVDKGDGIVEIEPSGDPSFLHPDFPNQPVYDFLKKQKTILLSNQNWKSKGWGMGWSWDDYEADYMAQRSMMPIYGNLVQFKKSAKPTASPAYFQQLLKIDSSISGANYSIRRAIGANQFSAISAKTAFAGDYIPFNTDDPDIIAQLLRDTLHAEVKAVDFKVERWPDVVKIHSQPIDSMLKIMMHRSDNFFAEQCLLMAGNELLGEMSTPKLIDTILKTSLKELPQKPKWVDGSGLSRYNLFSPEDFIYVLDKLRNEFAWNRISNIFASGGNGTLGSYYKNSPGKIYAKTGTLSNNVALSGYLITQKGQTLLFSVLVSNHTGNVANIRRSVEQFLNKVMANQ